MEKTAGGVWGVGCGVWGCAVFGQGRATSWLAVGPSQLIDEFHLIQNHSNASFDELVFSRGRWEGDHYFGWSS